MERRKRAAAAILLLINEHEQKKKRRYWVHPINRLRVQHGEFYRLITEMKQQRDERFSEYFHMTLNQYEDLLEKIRPHITKQNTHYRQAVPADQRLAVCLR